MRTRKYFKFTLHTLKLIACLSLFGVSSVFAAVCSNGSSVDCNPPGATLNASARFVDPNPPSGFGQCAGFINTSEDDVEWFWENNCSAFKEQGLFMRVFDDETGEILAGAHLFGGVVLGWSDTGFNYETDMYEGEGFLDNPNLDSQLPGGTSLAFHESDLSFCSCGRPGGGEGTCNDIFTTNAANDKIFYVGGNSSNNDYEAVFGPPGPKNTCSLIDEVVRLRVAIYGGPPGQPPPPALPVPALSLRTITLLGGLVLLLGFGALRRKIWR